MEDAAWFRKNNYSYVSVEELDAVLKGINVTEMRSAK